MGTEVLVGLGSGVARVTEIPVPNGITWQAESRIARMKTANNWRRIGGIIAAGIHGERAINQVLTESCRMNTPGTIT